MNEQDRLQQEYKRQWVAFFSKDTNKEIVLLAQDALLFRRPILGAIVTGSFGLTISVAHCSSLPFLSLTCALASVYAALMALFSMLLSPHATKSIDWIKKTMPIAPKAKWQLEPRSIDAIASSFASTQVVLHDCYLFMTYKKKIARRNVMLAQVTIFLLLSYFFRLIPDTLAACLIGSSLLSFPFVERLAIYHKYMPKVKTVAGRIWARVVPVFDKVVQRIPIRSVVFDPESTVEHSVYTPQPARNRPASESTSTSEPEESLTQSVTTLRRRVQTQQAQQAQQAQQPQQQPSAPAVDTTPPPYTLLDQSPAPSAPRQPSAPTTTTPASFPTLAETNALRQSVGLSPLTPDGEEVPAPQQATPTPHPSMYQPPERVEPNTSVANYLFDTSTQQQQQQPSQPASQSPDELVPISDEGDLKDLLVSSTFSVGGSDHVHTRMDDDGFTLVEKVQPASDVNATPKAPTAPTTLAPEEEDTDDDEYDDLDDTSY